MQKISIIKKIIKEDYDCFTEILQIKKIPNGDINSENFLIITSNEKFVIKFPKTSKNISKICDLMSFCNVNGILAPLPILNRKKKYYNYKTNSYITKYIPGNFFSYSNFQLKLLSKDLAKLHKVFKKWNFVFNALNDKLYKSLTSNELNLIYSKILRKKNKDPIDYLIIKNYDLLLKNLLFLKNQNFSTKSHQLIHNDLHFGNILFNKENKPIFLDFNSVANTNPLVDITFLALRFSKLNDELNIQKTLRIILKNYYVNNKISQKKNLEIEFYMKNTIFGRLSYIIRQKYVHNDVDWQNDCKKFLKYLKIVDNMKFSF